MRPVCSRRKAGAYGKSEEAPVIQYAHTQVRLQLELAEKIEADFYRQVPAGARPQPTENKMPVATKITGKMILEAIRQMGAEERRKLARVLLA